MFSWPVILLRRDSWWCMKLLTLGDMDFPTIGNPCRIYGLATEFFERCNEYALIQLVTVPTLGYNILYMYTYSRPCFNEWRGYYSWYYSCCLHLPTSFSLTPDQVPLDFIKEVKKYHIESHLESLFNLSFMRGDFLCGWKHSLIIRIPKNRHRTPLRLTARSL